MFEVEETRRAPRVSRTSASASPTVAQAFKRSASSEPPCSASSATKSSSSISESKPRSPRKLSSGSSFSGSRLVMAPTAARTARAALSRSPSPCMRGGLSLSGATRSANRRTSLRFTLRVEVRGSLPSTTVTTLGRIVAGSLESALSRARFALAWRSARLRPESSAGTATQATRSPPRGSVIPMIASSATPSMLPRRASTSSGYTFSPLAATITSLARPTITSWPFLSILPRSPVWSQPSESMTRRVASSSSE